MSAVRKEKRYHLYRRLYTMQNGNCFLCHRPVGHLMRMLDVWNAMSGMTKIEKQNMWVRAGYGGYRRRRTSINLSLDHFIPKSRGGSNDVTNLVLTHASCNIKKSNKILELNLFGEVVSVH